MHIAKLEGKDKRMEILSVLENYDGRLVKKLRIKKDRAVLVMKHEDGRFFVLRIYAQEIPSYRRLEGYSCENLPAVYHCENRDGFFLVEEEFIDGICLQDILDDGVRLDEAQAASVVKKVCEALKLLHENGFVHRDVKPEHVMLTPEKRLVLIDLDASMRIQPEKDTDTRLLGTAIYAAPEQFGLTRSDVRTDIYSMGILLNELLTGAHPAVTRYRGGRLDTVIETCIQMNPQDRYQSVEELVAALSSETGDRRNQKKTSQNPHGRWISRIAACVAVVVIFFGAGMLSGVLPDDIFGAEPGPADVEAYVDESNPWLQLYKGDEVIYYNFRQGSQAAELQLADGTKVDQSFHVYADPGIGVLEGWSTKWNAWRLTSEGCDMGAEGFLHAEKDGKHYAIRVVIMGEPISAYSSIPSMDDLAAGYLEPAVDPKNSSNRTIYCTYNPAKKKTIYLAAMHCFNHLTPVCSDPHVTIERSKETGGWPYNLFIMTFENPQGGTVTFDVTSEDSILTFVFEEE